MKKILSSILAFAIVLSLAVSQSTTAFASSEEAVDTRPRTIITTDLECDDIDSLLHLMLYSNDIDIAAIIVSASTHHWTGDGEHTMSEVLDDFQKGGDLTEWRPMELNWVNDMLLDEYASVYGNLSMHDDRYPTPGEMVERVKIGNVEFEGDMRFDTEGSNYIKQILLDDDEREVYVQAWGGANSFARALKSIEDEFAGSEQWNEICKKISEKTTLISWGDQDNTYTNYISVSWPEIHRMYCVTSGVGYFSSLNVSVPYRDYFKAPWLTKNIKFNHGDLMGKYLLFGDGTYYNGETPENQFGYMSTLDMEGCWLGGRGFSQYDYISEGDSPCWMYLIPTGLRGLENSDYGTWGGRMALQFNQRSGKETISAVSEFDPTIGKMSSGYSVHRWFPQFMNDWAARADWCVNGYEDANHQPVVTAECLDFTVYAGDTVELKGAATDPDGDNLNYDWWVYTDASKYSGAGTAYLDVWAHDVAETTFTVPADAAVGDYFNIVLSVTDDGAPALTRYAQAIVTVIEKPAE